MVIHLTGYIFDSHEFNFADSLMIICLTSLVFNGIEFNGTDG